MHFAVLGGFAMAMPATKGHCSVELPLNQVGPALGSHSLMFQISMLPVHVPSLLQVVLESDDAREGAKQSQRVLRKCSRSRDVDIREP